MKNLEILLSITKTSHNTYDYQYYSVLHGGVVVKVEGFYIKHATQFTIDLSGRTQEGFVIKQCLIPGGQDVVTVTELCSNRVVVVDENSEKHPEDYNFIIIAQNIHTGEQVICDPQIRNKGTT